MYWRLSFLVILISSLLGSYYYYKNYFSSGKILNYFSKEYEFTPKQVKFLKSIGVTPEDLSSISTMLAFAPLFASKTIDSAHENVKVLLDDPKVAKLFAQAYRLYRVPMDIAFKILGDSFPNHVSSIVNKLNSLLLDTQMVGEETKCTPVSLFASLQELVSEGKFDGMREFWKNHGSIVGLAKDAFPKSITDMFERFGNIPSLFGNTSSPRDENSNSEKDDDSN